MKLNQLPAQLAATVLAGACCLFFASPVVASVPVGITLSNASINENNAIGDAIGTLASGESEDVHTYELVAGEGDADNASFAISANSLNAAIVFNFESKGSYSIRVKATDSGETPATVEQVFTITIVNVAETPPSISAQTLPTLAENSAANTVVGTVAASDPDADDVLTYDFDPSVTQQNPGGIFVIDSATGQIKVANLAQTTINSILDYDLSRNPSTSGALPFVLRVRVTDRDLLTSSANVTVALSNVNEAFVIGDQNFVIDINAFNGTEVGTVQYTDQDLDTLTFTIQSSTPSTAAAAFSFTGAKLILSNAGAVNFGANPQVQLTVRGADSGANGVQPVTFKITVTAQPTNVPGGNPVLMGLPGIQITDIAYARSGEIFIVGPGANASQGILTFVSPQLDSINTIKIADDFTAKSIELSDDAVYIGGQVPSAGKARIYMASLPVSGASSFTFVDVYSTASTLVDMALHETAETVNLYVCGTAGTDSANDKKHFFKKFDEDLSQLTVREWGFANTPLPNILFGGSGSNLNDAVGDVFAIAVDDLGFVYVSGNWLDPAPAGSIHWFWFWGYPVPISTYTGLQSATGNIYFFSRFAQQRVGYIARFDPTTGNNVAYTQDFQYFNVNHTMRVKDMTFASSESGGALYVLQEFSGTSNLGHTAISDEQAVKVSRFDVNLVLVGPASSAIYNLASAGEGVRCSSLSKDDDGNIFITGILPQGTMQFNQSPTQPGVTPPQFTPSFRQFFAAKLTPSLTWDWVKILNTGNYSPSLDDPPVIRWYPYGKAAILGGTMNSGGKLTLRQEGAEGVTIENSIVAPASAKGGFVTFITADGDYVERLFIEIISRFGLSADHVKPHLGRAIGVAGQTYTASVPEVLYQYFDTSDSAYKYLPVPTSENDIKQRALVRFVNRGYTVEDTEIIGDSSTYTFVLRKNITITFHWDVEYALSVGSDLTTSGSVEDTNNPGNWEKNSDGLGLTSVAAGNPQPSVKKHWIKENELVVAFIDGTALDPIDFGTRYRTTGYTASGAAKIGAAATGLRTFPSLETRQQIQQFVMNGPAAVTYQWKPQHRVLISTSSSRSATLPGIRVDDGSGQPNFFGTGEAWYDRGTRITIAARDDDASNQQMLGWLSSEGQFQTPQSSANGRNRLTASFVFGSNTYRGYSIGAGGLVLATRVLWNYGDRIYPTIVTLGDSVLYPTGFPVNDIKSPNNIIKKPNRVRIVESPPGSSVDDMNEWDDKAKLSYPVRPGIYFLEWDKQNSDEKIVLQVTSGFGGDRIAPNDSQNTAVFSGTKRHYKHLTHPDIPKVILDRSTTDDVAFHAVKYTETDAIVAEGGFSAEQPGRHVLLFSKSAASAPPATGDRNSETLLVRVVETRKWNAVYDASDPDDVVMGAWNDQSGTQMLMVADAATEPAIIGQKLTSTLDTAQIGTGFIVNSNARYNARIYDRTKVADAGPIIPVNRHFTGDSADDLVVVWYEKAPENILWPYQSIQYTAKWPTRSYFTKVLDEQDAEIPQPVDRIVMASRVGSEGKNSFGNDQTFFDLGRYSQVTIYNQPDRSRPGYNPNEEHALIAPSFKFLDQSNPPPTAYALRTDLNVRTQDQTFTSDPYVLVEYFDRDAGENGEFKMVVYAIEKEDFRASLNPYRYPEIDPDPEDPNDQREFPYTFNYKMEAGEPVQPPYPLGIVIGLTPCGETRGTNLGAGRTYWEDYRGQPWAVSDGQFQSVFYYPQLVDFWNGEGASAMPPGTCLEFKTGGEVIVNSTAADPTFENGSTFTVNGQMATINGTDAAAFVAAVTEIGSAANVTATLLFGGQIRIESTDLSSIVMGDGLHNPLDTAGVLEGTRTETLAVKYTAHWPDELPILKVGETLTFSGGEYKADNPGPEQPGLPGVIGWSAGKIVYDSTNPLMDNQLAFTDYGARLISPLEERTIQLSAQDASDLETIIQPATGLTKVDGVLWRFTELPSSLAKRIFYDPLNDRLGIKGFLNDKTLGDTTLTATPPPVYVLEPNILTPRELDVLLLLDEVKDLEAWRDAVEDLYALSRNPERLRKTGGPGLSPGGIEPSYYVGLEMDVEQENNQDKLDEDGNPITLANTARHRVALGPGLALVPSPQLLETGDPSQTCYVTLAENDDANIGGPVSLHIVKIVKKYRYRGAIKTILSDNVFDERITLRHTGDFGANGDEIVYQWFYREENGLGAPLPPDSAWRLFPDQSDNSVKGLGLYQISLEGAGGPLLADNLFFVRYRHLDDTPADGNPNSVEWAKGSPSKTYGTEWNRDGAPFRDPYYRDAQGNLDDSLRNGGEWAGAANSPTVDRVYRPQLVMGWIKRVLDRINPYEARFENLRDNTAPATYASMIQQAGQRHEGPVALNPDKDVIENVGLIELYQTILDRGINLSIGLSSPITTPGINNALLLAATRISDLYMLLGNDALIDAKDPTIGFGSGSVEYGSMAPAVFAFQNQMSTLLEEELGLLRGIDDSRGRPVYNRLFWNFTKGEGEVAYAMNYNLADVTMDGFIDESDALTLYPQGHGDAWGHYLTAMKTRYSLLRHPFFNWQPRSEFYNLFDVVIEVDFLDERKFAEAAAAKAEVGAGIVDMTYRSRYVEDPAGQWQGYSDPIPNRNWGVADWARRAGQGALFDWITANALIPAQQTDPLKEGIERVDRSTVKDIAKISANLGAIQTTYDNANNGLNPLGLDSDVVTFDLDPTFGAGFLDIGPETHFEQIYNRAQAALQNAAAAFDYANERKTNIRKVADSVDAFRQDVIQQDREYRNKLIEIFGTPYEGTIGTGKPYPAGYEGPDLSLYMYVDIRDISAETVPAPSATYAAKLEGFDNDLRAITGDFESTLDDYFLNNLDANLVSWTGVVLTDNSVLELQLPATAGSYTFQAPSDWGRRASPGRLQQIISAMVQAEADLAMAVGNYDVLVAKIEHTANIIEAKHGLAAESIRIKTRERNTMIALDAVISVLRTVAFGFHTASKFTDKTGESTAEFIPKNTPTGGLAVSAGDVLAPLRGTIKAVSNTVSDVLDVLGNASDLAIAVIDDRKAVIQLNDQIQIDTEGFKKDLREALRDLEEILINEGTTRIAAFKLREQLRSLGDQYRAALQEGVRLIDERLLFNQKTAAATQKNRYQDMAFRVSHNEALQKYRASFDLAARYVYMAAKAYDFETNLSPNDRGSAQPLLTEVVRQRTVGAVIDGEPSSAGGGLAGILAVLRDNFGSIESQIGLNNPQRENNSFSMRGELFGIGQLPDTDAIWRAELTKYRWNDLWDSPEFRRFCRPFAERSPGRSEPGLIIPFSTEIRAGRNFFGRQLQPGHSAYDPSNFATKIRSVAIDFAGYNVATLSQTPRVYLIPAGMDVMAIPTSRELELRMWNVVDQRIPAPFKTGVPDLQDPDWIPVLDSLNGPLGEIRRFSSFRAFPGDAEELVFDTRLVGRSVWNTQWLLVIPGQTFLADSNQGLNTFIQNVTDIRLSFETYGTSGN